MNEPEHNPKADRAMRNLLLQPSLQMRLGILSIIVAVVFCATTLILIYNNLNHFFSLVVDLTGLEEEVSRILGEYLRSLTFAIVAIVVLYLVVTLFLSIYYTHRLVGPTIAFRRHIRSLIDGNFESRVVLRRHDAFVEVADDLNELAKKLQNQNSKPTSLQ